MVRSLTLLRNIVGVIGVVVLVLGVVILLKNENQRISASSAEIQGVADNYAGNKGLTAESSKNIPNEILRSTRYEKISNGGSANTNLENSFYQVIKVIDGDTIVVEINGARETVRLIGINAPEIGEKNGEKCLGKEAAERAKRILQNSEVKLEADDTQDDRDKYNRLLRYIILKDGSNFNEILVREGFAKEYTYKIAYKYQMQFKKAEQEARKAKRGLWSDNACNSSSKEILTNKNSAIATGDCFCEKNTYNCSDFKTHAEAQSIFECCMNNIGKDIHKLDGNNDGQVCESLP